MQTLLQGHASCLRVDGPTRDELRDIARNRVLLIDYFTAAGPWGVCLGDVELRWFEREADLPPDVIRLDDVEDVPVYLRPELAPLLAAVRARLEIAGPHVLPFLRHPSIVIEDGERWLDFFTWRAPRTRWPH